MSIKLQNQFKELWDKVEVLERKMNKLSPEVRIVAGVEDPDPPKRTRRSKEEMAQARAEGS